MGSNEEVWDNVIMTKGLNNRLDTPSNNALPD